MRTTLKKMMMMGLLLALPMFCLADDDDDRRCHSKYHRNHVEYCYHRHHKSCHKRHCNDDDWLERIENWEKKRHRKAKKYIKAMKRHHKDYRKCHTGFYIVAGHR